MMTAYCPRCDRVVDLVDNGETCASCGLVLPAERPVTASIHLTVPASLKARWVRESRAAGQRLTDWLISRIERQPLG